MALHPNQRPAKMIINEKINGEGCVSVQMVRAQSRNPQVPTTPNLEVSKLYPVIILVAPQLGENIGATARAMKNFGLNQLRLVSPRDGWPNEKALSMSAHASDIIERAEIYSCLEDAIADIEYLYATTAIERDLNKSYVFSKDLGATYPYNLKTAIMFGRENSGLNNNEISLAHKIINIDTAEFSSLNIAQAVIIVCYELFNNRPSNIGGKAEFNKQPLATRHELSLFFDHLFCLLDEKQFFRVPEKKPQMTQKIINIFSRVEKLSRSELQTLRGILNIFDDKHKDRSNNRK